MEYTNRALEKLIRLKADYPDADLEETIKVIVDQLSMSKKHEKRIKTLIANSVVAFDACISELKEHPDKPFGIDSFLFNKCKKKEKSKFEKAVIKKMFISSKDSLDECRTNRSCSRFAELCFRMADVAEQEGDLEKFKKYCFMASNVAKQMVAEYHSLSNKLLMLDAYIRMIKIALAEDDRKTAMSLAEMGSELLSGIE